MTRVTDSVNSASPLPSTIKFLYSYNGKIMPRQIDGKLRYIGGHTRILSVDRSISFSELSVKFFEACGFSGELKCKLPSEDLDVLVSVTGDDDLKAVVEEYRRVSPESKIRAVLFPVKSLKTISPVPSDGSLVDFTARKPPRYPVKSAVKSCRDAPPFVTGFRPNPRRKYVVQGCNYSQ
uniref:uncharacterized protein LOC122580177 n=1 Tax=Erigeron canadensis TaxID=72917 RepID=UPI001CB89DB5|nr:uncharacterized protein LOC122580177 [Erigeron canadensis]